MAAGSDKVDFRRALPRLYAPRNRDWEFVEVPEMWHLQVAGAGDPNTSDDYADAVAALYSVAYPLKFHAARELGRDYVVPPLEGLWYADDPTVFRRGEKAAYRWTMLVMQPPWITADLVADALVAAARKKPGLPHDRVRFAPLAEGRCLQLLHRGSYDDEAPVLARLHDEVMPALGVDFNGHHHEVYLTDPRRTVPERLRTILRQPVR